MVKAFKFYGRSRWVSVISDLKHTFFRGLNALNLRGFFLWAKRLEFLVADWALHPDISPCFDASLATNLKLWWVWVGRCWYYQKMCLHSSRIAFDSLMVSRQMAQTSCDASILFLTLEVCFKFFIAIFWNKTQLFRDLNNLVNQSELKSLQDLDNQQLTD